MGAQADYKAGRFAEALAKAKEAGRLADVAEPKLTELPRQIHQLIAAGEVTPQRIKEIPCGREPR